MEHWQLINVPVIHGFASATKETVNGEVIFRSKAKYFGIKVRGEGRLLEKNIQVVFRDR